MKNGGDFTKKTISYIMPIISIMLFLLFAYIAFFVYEPSNKNGINKILKSDINNKEVIAGIITYNNDNILKLRDDEGNIYTFNNKEIESNIGTNITLNCKGKLDLDQSIQECLITNYEILKKSSIPLSYLDNGIFSNYYYDAYNKLQTMSLDEKISQLLLVRYPTSNGEDIAKQYNFGGYIFFEKDFKNKTKDEVIAMIKNVQNAVKIPMLTAIDEEGGIVSRISSNKNLVSEPFKSSQELYALGEFKAIKEDVINKSKILKELGLNLNLAPVVDVSTNPKDYIYKRTLGKGTELTNVYAATVIKASKGTDVSYTLKHFPGYGSNKDTHVGNSIDTKTYTQILKEDIPPFIEGINNGAEAIMVSHNTVTSIDKDNPASISKNVNNLLRNDLKFTGIIMTDDLSMSAVSKIENVESKALNAGNDLLITSDYEKSITNIKNSLANNELSENDLNEKVFRILAWKYYKHLI